MKTSKKTAQDHLTHTHHNSWPQSSDSKAMQLCVICLWLAQAAAATLWKTDLGIE